MNLELGHAWEGDLWKSPYRLRFELNSGGAYVSMFTSSYDRARSLARAALPTDTVLAIIAAHPDPKRELGAKEKGWTSGSAFELLADMGVATQPFGGWNGYVWPGDKADPDAKPWVHRASLVNWEQADILLWNQIAHDIGVTPQAPVISKLVDVERGVSVFAYDDRGLDVTALSAASILSVGNQFEGWLLDYDRLRMSEAFGVGWADR